MNWLVRLLSKPIWCILIIGIMSSLHSSALLTAQVQPKKEPSPVQPGPPTGEKVKVIESILTEQKPDNQKFDSQFVRKKNDTSARQMPAREQILRMRVEDLLDMPFEQVLEYAKIAGVYPFNNTTPQKKQTKAQKKKLLQYRSNRAQLLKLKLEDLIELPLEDVIELARIIGLDVSGKKKK